MPRTRRRAASFLGGLAVVVLTGALFGQPVLDDLGQRLDDPRPAGTPLTPPPVAAAGAAQLLEQLPVPAAAQVSGYDRDEFGPAWTDDVDVAGGHNGCDTRNDILRRDADPGTLHLKADTGGCKVLAGAWTSPYTATVLTDLDQVHVDHIVPLAVAWSSGAHAWTARQRANFANDPAGLLAVDAGSNLAKSDAAPQQWLPAPAYRCQYAAAWINVKAAYALSVTAAEKAALGELLLGCQAGQR